MKLSDIPEQEQIEHFIAPLFKVMAVVSLG